MGKLKDKLEAATAQQLARRPSTVMGIFQDDLIKRQLQAALPAGGLTAQRLLVVALNELRQNEDLMECTRDSFVGALLQAAHLGLEVGGQLGHFYLVPFKNTAKGVREVVPILGYRGIIALARRSDQLASIGSRAVYDKDFFEWEYGLEDKLVHRPAMTDDRGKIVAFYGVARFTNGGVQMLVMSKAQVDSFRKRSKAASSSKSPWETDYEAMGCKTVIRRMEPYLPLTTEAAAVIQADEAREEGRPAPDELDLGDLIETEPKARKASAPAPAETPATAATEAPAPAAAEAPAVAVPAVCAICGVQEDENGHIKHDDERHVAAAAEKRKAREQQGLPLEGE